MTIRIAVDAMGGDRAPGEIVGGALLAAERLDCEVILVGDEAAVRPLLAAGKPPVGKTRVVHASQTIEMSEHPTDAVREKPDSSMAVALRMVKSGDADAFVTMGNTGAAMAGALLTLGRVRGIARPALGVVFPSGAGRTMLLDVGANSENRAAHLVQFAHMGTRYMETMFGLNNPRVGLVSIGEEDTKGNDLVIEVNQALRQSSLNFVGNVEGRDMTRGAVDVAVTDGFTGNVMLKTAEGIGEMLFTELRAAVNRRPWYRLAGMVLLPELRKVRSRLDYSEYGGVQLLGVEGITVIGHGRSNARAVYNGIRAARDAVATHVLDRMHAVAADVPGKPSPSDA